SLHTSHTTLSFFFFFSMRRPPPSSTLFPYTTLFRSAVQLADPRRGAGGEDVAWYQRHHARHPSNYSINGEDHLRAAGGLTLVPRSEEHTSELQSRGHLVCRLLLEKKKQNKKYKSEIR